MVLKVGVEVPDRGLEITALVKDVFGDLYQAAALVCNDSSTTGHVIYQRDLSE